MHGQVGNRHYSLINKQTLYVLTMKQHERYENEGVVAMLMRLSRSRAQCGQCTIGSTLHPYQCTVGRYSTGAFWASRGGPLNSRAPLKLAGLDASTLQRVGCQYLHQTTAYWMASAQLHHFGPAKDRTAISISKKQI